MLHEWVDRARRQLEYVHEEALKSLPAEIALHEEPTVTGAQLSVDTGAIGKFEAYLRACSEKWVSSFSAGIDDGFHAAVSSGTRDAALAAAPLTRRPAWKRPNPPGGSLGPIPPSRDAELPNFGGALLMSLRSGMTLVSTFTTILVATGAWLFRSTTHGASDVQYGPIVTVLALPALGVIAYLSARRQQRVLRHRAIASLRQSSTSWFRTESEKFLERTRKYLERLANERVAEWNDAVDAWIETTIDPKLAASDAAATEAARELKFQQSKINEEQLALKSFRTQLQQSILFELRRRRAEIDVEPASKR